mmetsp:Transcript_89198/g.252927  ORF Transcript_89198/g.252927 Transcript_89198/m.252927 type:complete len:284 (-) Transcript_89198:125-976(-)
MDLGTLALTGGQPRAQLHEHGAKTEEALVLGGEKDAPPGVLVEPPVRVAQLVDDVLDEHVEGVVDLLLVHEAPGVRERLREELQRREAHGRHPVVHAPVQQHAAQAPAAGALVRAEADLEHACGAGRRHALQVQAPQEGGHGLYRLQALVPLRGAQRRADHLAEGLAHARVNRVGRRLEAQGVPHLRAGGGGRAARARRRPGQLRSLWCRSSRSGGRQACGGLRDLAAGWGALTRATLHVPQPSQRSFARVQVGVAWRHVGTGALSRRAYCLDAGVLPPATPQ